MRERERAQGPRRPARKGASLSLSRARALGLLEAPKGEGEGSKKKKKSGSEKFPKFFSLPLKPLLSPLHLSPQATPPRNASPPRTRDISLQWFRYDVRATKTSSSTSSRAERASHAAREMESNRDSACFLSACPIVDDRLRTRQWSTSSLSSSTLCASFSDVSGLAAIFSDRKLRGRMSRKREQEEEGRELAFDERAAAAAVAAIAAAAAFFRRCRRSRLLRRSRVCVPLACGEACWTSCSH